jgi:hypothetical protein
VGDLDDDGRIDVVVNDLDGVPQVLHNQMPGTGRWLRMHLRGRAPNTSAVGARILVKTADGVQRRLVRSGTSYISQCDKRQHFGLGEATKAEWVEVVWPDGTSTRRTDVAAGQTLEIRQ